MNMSVTAYDTHHIPSRLDPTSIPIKTYTIVVERGEDGWLVATCSELQGLVTQGKNEEEVEKNALEAVSLMLEGTPEENKGFKLWVIYKDSE